VKRFFLYALVVTQLFACASVDSVVQKKVPVAGFENAQNILAIKGWQLLGRLSVRSERESWLAILEWQHDALVDDLVLSTSLGGVIAKLKYSNDAIVLSDAKDGVREVSNKELHALLGYAPPLAHLKFWVRGGGDPQWPMKVKEASNAGDKVFEQDGWLVKLGRFRQEGELILPSKVFIQKDGVKIKLVIDKWLM